MEKQTFTLWVEKWMSGFGAVMEADGLNDWERVEPREADLALGAARQHCPEHQVKESALALIALGYSVVVRHRRTPPIKSPALKKKYADEVNRWIEMLGNGQGRYEIL